MLATPTVITFETKTWARAEAGVVAELRGFPAAFVPGTDMPACWAFDVTDLDGAAVGWLVSGSTIAPPAPTRAELVAHAEARQVALRDGGITVNVGDASTPDEVNVASDVNGRSLVSGCVQLVGLATQNSQPAPTFPWINDGGTQLTLTAAQMMTIGYKLGAFVQATYTTLGAVLAAISAGSITTTAQIDAAAWPATSY